MRITAVALENIKSYQKIEVPLSAGTTAIRGHNGAGKSTLVEAIGFALFDSINYPQDQFVREGERYGVVTVSFLSAEDDREYQAVRRCGSSPTWYIYDPQLQMRVVEQKTDVNDFLRRHLRIETDIVSARPLQRRARHPARYLYRRLPDDSRQPQKEIRYSAADRRLPQSRRQAQRHPELSARRAAQHENRIAELERETAELDTWRADLAELRRQQQAIVRLEE